MGLILPTPAFLFSLGNGQSTTRPGDSLSCTRWGQSISSARPLRKPFCRVAGSAVLSSCRYAGNSLPFVCPSDPICSATAQIQFRRHVLPASSWALSLRNHSNPPRQRPSNLNKPSDISLAGCWTGQSPCPPLWNPGDLSLTPLHNVLPCHHQARRHISWWI